MTLRSEVQMSTIVWQGGTAPDGLSYDGDVIATPNVVNGLVNWPAASPPFSETVQPATASFDADGNLSLDVVSNGDPATNPTAWTYTLTFVMARGVKINPVVVEPLTPGETYELTQLMPGVPASPGQVNVVATTGAKGDKGDPGTPGTPGTPGATGPGITAGIILPFGGTAAPSGYLMCDGSAVSRTTYSALFGVLGTAYGTGDGSTTFNVPNLNGGANPKFPAGATPGSSGGAAAHTHSVPSLSVPALSIPAHTHPLSSNGQAQMNPGSTNYYNLATTTSWTSQKSQTANNAITTGVNQTSGVALTGATDSAGAGSTGTGTTGTGTTGSGSTLPPYVGVNYIVKT